MTPEETKLADYLIAYGKAATADKVIEEAAAHFDIPFDTAREMVRALELREELFRDTDPARNAFEGEPARALRCWWQRKRPQGVARLE